MIRVRRTDDHDLIADLDSQCFIPEEHLTEAEIDACEWWVATLDGEPVGYAGARVCKTDRALVYLSKCGVLPIARGRRIQQRLIRARVAWARAQPGRTHAITYTLSHNAPSSNSLIRCGFRTYSADWAGSSYAIYWIRSLYDEAPVLPVEV